MNSQKTLLGNCSGEGETTGSKIMFSLSRLKRSEWIPAFTTRVDQTNGSTLVKLILFEKSRVERIRFFNLYDKSPETPWKLHSFPPLVQW